MPDRTFAQVTAQIGQHFQNREYAEALDVATREAPRFPRDKPFLDYYAMCAAARVSDYTRVYAMLEAGLQQGVWYGEYLLRQSPSFQPLQGQPEFERLVAASLEAQAQDTSSQSVLVTRRPGHHSAASPLLLALHGNNSTADASFPFWQAAADQGWLVAVPQSSQALYKGASHWTEHAAAVADIQPHFEALRGQFDPSQVVVAGHSMGGEIAIGLALRGTVGARGFITIGPGGPFTDEPEQWRADIEAARERNLRGYFIVGEKDDLIQPQAIQTLAGMLNAAGLPAQVERVPDATHDFTPAYEAALLRGLAFVSAA
jgi:dienelactone hydrolase